MLTEPFQGWSTVVVGDFQQKVGYLTDVPMDCLRAFVFGLKYHLPAAIYFDEEDIGTFILTTHYDRSYIIRETSCSTVFAFSYTIKELAKELIDDITDHIDGWTNYLCITLTTEEATARKRTLISLVDELTELTYGD